MFTLRDVLRSLILEINPIMDEDVVFKYLDKYMALLGRQELWRV